MKFPVKQRWIAIKQRPSTNFLIQAPLYTDWTAYKLATCATGQHAISNIPELLPSILSMIYSILQVPL